MEIWILSSTTSIRQLAFFGIIRGKWRDRITSQLNSMGLREICSGWERKSRLKRKMESNTASIHFREDSSRLYRRVSILDYSMSNGLRVWRFKWPDGEFQRIENAGVNQTLRLRYEDATTGQNDETSDVQAVFKSVQAIDFQHQDPYYNDFKHQPLLPHKLSQLGPPLAKGDINSDGRIDVFVGGAAGSPGVLFQQKQDESFQALTFAALEQDKASEDVDAVFFDADGDGDLDLYVASGSYEFEENDPLLADRIYFNEGEGSWGVRDNALPEINLSSGCVAASDYDSDGDVDLFVGGRLVPRKYPQPSDSYLLVNDGGGQFQNASSTRIPESKKPWHGDRCPLGRCGFRWRPRPLGSGGMDGNHSFRK